MSIRSKKNYLGLSCTIIHFLYLFRVFYLIPFQNLSKYHYFSAFFQIIIFFPYLFKGFLVLQREDLRGKISLSVLKDKCKCNHHQQCQKAQKARISKQLISRLHKKSSSFLSSPHTLLLLLLTILYYGR